MQSKYLQLVLLVLSLSAAIYAQDSAVTENSYLYKIHISEVPGGHGPLIQRGFKLDGTPGIITTLHGVCELNQVFTVDDQVGGHFKNVKLYWVDIANDAAMVGNDELFKLSGGLQVPKELTVSRGEACEAWGMPLGAFEWKKPVTLSDPPIYELNTRITGEMLKLFEKRQSPSLDVKVFGLDGAITPGYSGAPLVRKKTHEIIGMVDGGILEETNIAWAIPISAFRWQEPRKDLSVARRLESLASLSSSHLFRTLDNAAKDGKQRDRDSLLLGTWKLVEIHGSHFKQLDVMGQMVIFRDPKTREFRATGDFSSEDDDSYIIGSALFKMKLTAKFNNCAVSVGTPTGDEVYDARQIAYAGVSGGYSLQKSRFIHNKWEVQNPVNHARFNIWFSNWNSDNLHSLFEYGGVDNDINKRYLIFERVSN